jgi:hypothetical protein
VRDKVGDGRVCADGQLGQDSQGACVPAFGEVKDAWTYFDAHCSACGDSEACQAACKVIMEQAPFVVDETRAHPDVCPSFDCPDCVGPCTSCSAVDCVQWCDARHAPTAHCSAGAATSVQGLFEDRSLTTRSTAAEKAMGTFYDNKCKAESVQRAHDYFAAFAQPVTRFAPLVRRAAPPPQPQSSTAAADYLATRASQAEQLRARQLNALGISASFLRVPVRPSTLSSTTFRPAPSTLTHQATQTPPDGQAQKSDPVSVQAPTPPAAHASRRVPATVQVRPRPQVQAQAQAQAQAQVQAQVQVQAQAQARGRRPSVIPSSVVTAPSSVPVSAPAEVRPPQDTSRRPRVVRPSSRTWR